MCLCEMRTRNCSFEVVKQLMATVCVKDLPHLCSCLSYIPSINNMTTNRHTGRNAHNLVQMISFIANLHQHLYKGPCYVIWALCGWGDCSNLLQLPVNTFTCTVVTQTKQTVKSLNSARPMVNYGQILYITKWICLYTRACTRCFLLRF